MFEDKMTRRVIVARERAFVEEWEEKKNSPVTPFLKRTQFHMKLRRRKPIEC